MGRRLTSREIHFSRSKARGRFTLIAVPSATRHRGPPASRGSLPRPPTPTGEGLQELGRSLPRLAHRGIPRTREEAAGLTAAPELGTGPEDHEHAFQGRQPSLTPTLQGDEGRLSDLNEG